MHPRQRELGRIGKKFRMYPESRSVLSLLVREAEPLARKVSPKDLLVEDADEDGVSVLSVNPEIDIEALKARHSAAGWVRLLGKADRGLEGLFEEYLKTFGGDPRRAMDSLGESMDENFWVFVPELSEEFEDIYDSLRESYIDSMSRQKDPYSYLGVSRRDFMASNASVKRVLSRYAGRVSWGD